VARLSTLAGDSVGGQGPPHAPGEVREGRHVPHAELLSGLLYQEEPVASPGHVAGYRAKAIHLHADVLAPSITRHIADGNVPVFMQARRNNTHGRLDSVLTGLDPAEIGEGGHEADGPVAAHAEKADVVEEDDSRRARR